MHNSDRSSAVNRLDHLIIDHLDHMDDVDHIDHVDRIDHLDRLEHVRTAVDPVSDVEVLSRICVLSIQPWKYLVLIDHRSCRSNGSHQVTCARPYTPCRSSLKYLHHQATIKRGYSIRPTCENMQLLASILVW